LRARGFNGRMRALLLRRTAFLAILVTGLALTASAVHGLSGMDRSLQLAAVTQQERTVPVSDPGPLCDGYREHGRLS
jgi:hypothetical protein